MMGLMAGCGGDDNTTGPTPQTAVALQSGDGQTQTVGQALASPVVVRVSRDGQALPGATVSWSVTAGGGSVNPASSTTDGSGLASTTWTLGPAVGANTLEAAVSGATNSPVSFSASGESATLPTTASVTVGAGGNNFSPTSVSIATGGEVTWTWAAGSVDHNVTFSSGSNSATQDGGTFQRTFPTAGSFDYLCTIHGAAMSGTVVVQ